MKSRFVAHILLIILIWGGITHLPVHASGIVTTCDETALETALVGGGTVDFDIGEWCEIIFTSEKIISDDTTIQNTSGHTVVFSGDYYTPIDTRFFTVNSGISLTLDNLTLMRGKASFGGAIYNNEGNLNISNSAFLSNEATETNAFDPGGGAIYNFYGVLNITNTIFDSNFAGTLGSAILSSGFTENLIVGSRFINNTGTSEAGAIYIAPEFSEEFTSSIGQVIIQDSYFENNASASGSNLRIHSAVSEIRGNTFAGSQDNYLGSVIYTGDSVVVSDNIFINHTGVTPLFIDTYDDLSFSIQRNSFINNSVTGFSCSAFWITSMEVDSSLTGDVSNNTFYGNNTSNDGSTMCVSSNVIMDLVHNTFLDNNTPMGSNLKISSGANVITAYGNIFEGGDCIVTVDGGALTDGGNNIAYNAPGCVGANVDPQLMPMFSYAFVPSATSPAVDAYATPCAVSDDQFGTARPLGSACDIGAIEGVASPNTTITTCNEMALNLALAGGGTVDFDIGADCLIPFTFEKIIGTTTTIQNTSPHTVTFDGDDSVRLLTVNNGATLTLDNLILQNAYALSGGAVFNDASTLVVNNSIFRDNTVYTQETLDSDIGNGGAIFVFGEATTTIANSVFMNNLARFGGAIYTAPIWDDDAQIFYAGDLTITNSVFTENVGIANDNAIVTGYGTVQISNSQFYNHGNDPSFNPSVVSIFGGDVIIEDNAFFDNNVTYTGVVRIWGVFSQTTNFSVQRNSFINNTSENDLGFSTCSAMTILDEPYGNVLIGDITNNTFSGNSASSDGATLCLAGNVTASLAHNTFVNNNTPMGNNIRISGVEEFFSPPAVYPSITLTANIFQDGDCLFPPETIITDGGNNIAYDATGCVGEDLDPQLGILTNGTHHIPATDQLAYDPPCAVAVDQLGAARPNGVFCTAGAIEILELEPHTITVQFASASGSAPESEQIGNVLLVTTSDDLPTYIETSVNITVTGGTASPDDYILTGTITIPQGTNHNATVSVDTGILIVDDRIDEPDETLELTLVSPVGAVLGAQITYTHTILDDDDAGYTLDTSMTTNISEPDGTTTFTIRLTSEPTGTVILDFASTDETECLPNPTQFTFTNDNWNVEQTITITAQDDNIVDGTQPCEISISRNGSSTASEYGSVSNPSNVAILVLDDDVAGYMVDTSMTTNISEPDGTTTFTIRLTSEPTGTVILDFASTDETECLPNPTQFTFTNANWDVAQPITIMAQEDDVVDGTQPCEISISRNGSSTASEYGSVSNPSNVAILVFDGTIIERDLILTENGLRHALASQSLLDVTFFVVDIAPTNITIIIGYAGENGQVVIGVDNADMARFTILSITPIGGGSVSDAFNDYVYQNLLALMMHAIDEWIIMQVSPLVAEIKSLVFSDIAIVITVDISH